MNWKLKCENPLTSVRQRTASVCIVRNIFLGGQDQNRQVWTWVSSIRWLQSWQYCCFNLTLTLTLMTQDFTWTWSTNLEYFKWCCKMCAANRLNQNFLTSCTRWINPTAPSHIVRAGGKRLLQCRWAERQQMIPRILTFWCKDSTVFNRKWTATHANHWVQKWEIIVIESQK